MESNKDHPCYLANTKSWELGRGGFGIVYRAFDTVLEVEQAIETIPTCQPRLVNRFKQEARIVPGSITPTSCQCDFGQIDGKYYLAMGYTGGSLKDLLVKNTEQG